MKFKIAILIPDLPQGDQNDLLIKNFLESKIKKLHMDVSIEVSTNINQIFISGTIIKYDIYKQIKGPKEESQLIIFKQKYKNTYEDGGNIYTNIALDSLKNRLRDLVLYFLNKYQWKTNMRWTKEKLFCTRPIRSIQFECDNQLIEGDFNGVIFKKINSNHDYYSDRLQLVKNISEKIALENNLTIVSKELIKKIAYLYLKPMGLLIEFDKKFLSMHRDIVQYSLEENNFALGLEKNGTLVNKAIVFFEENKQIKKENFLLSLEAKLLDFYFMFKRDIKKDKNYFIEKNKTKLLHSAMGTIEEKIERMKIIAEKTQLNCGNYIENYQLDITSNLVSDTPSLVGVIGSSIFKDENIRLIHTKPKTIETVNVAIIDKIDKLKCFENFIPKGKQDPYKIKRTCNQLSELLLDNNKFIKLDYLGKSRDFFINCYEKYIFSRFKDLKYLKINIEELIKYKNISINIPLLTRIKNLEKNIKVIEREESASLEKWLENFKEESDKIETLINKEKIIGIYPRESQVKTYWNNCLKILKIEEIFNSSESL